LTGSAESDGAVNFVRLPFAAEEAEKLADLLPESERTLWTRFEATRRRATSDEMSQFRIIHFATHGLLDFQHPKLSCLVLSRFNQAGQPQDGYVRLQDVYNMRLSADLVVLSACQTALGKEVRGEGLVGLTRGFIYAGAARVVASLWNVDDSATAKLMERFYKKMLGPEKLRPAAALRAAQIEMMADEHWQDPYFWAGFVLQGEWR
jgi:CHAT domain-containing protein